MARWIAVGILFAVLIGGLLYPPLRPVATVMMVVLLTICAFHGRHWWGNLCPRGSFLDLIVRWIAAGWRFPAFPRTLRVRVVIPALLMSALPYSRASLQLCAEPGRSSGAQPRARVHADQRRGVLCLRGARAGLPHRHHGS